MATTSSQSPPNNGSRLREQLVFQRKVPKSNAKEAAIDSKSQCPRIGIQDQLDTFRNKERPPSYLPHMKPTLHPHLGPDSVTAELGSSVSLLYKDLLSSILRVLSPTGKVPPPSDLVFGVDLRDGNSTVHHLGLTPFNSRRDKDDRSVTC
ncbi:hypothetical protein GOODEAATRI_012901 [Goodea atripinnis]|uniref:Uncharacterized protein n=1 Tax=Goodea atripinnis TaxID=208336 RepID=A0ABV0PDM4_9TELE